MDVRNWLEHIVDRRTPPADFRRGELIGLDEAELESPRQERMRRRKRRARSVPRSNSRQQDQLVSSGSSSSITSSATGGDVPSARRGTDSQQPRRSIRESAPRKTRDNQVYEKLRRNKTRSDLYEPRAKKAKKDKRAAPKPRKSKRAADGVRTSELVRKFQLNHGSRKDRLTVSSRLRII